MTLLFRYVKFIIIIILLVFMSFLNFFLQTDKLKHFTLSILLFIGIFLIRKYILKRKWNLKELSFSLRDVLVIWILKEILDMFWFGNPEYLDFFADSFAMILVFYFYYFYKEYKKTTDSKLIKKEIVILENLIDRLILFFKNLYFYICIQFRIIYYKRRIIYMIPKIKRSYLLKKSYNNLIEIWNYFLHFSLIWLYNLLIQIIKIPFLAFYDAINGIIWMIKYSFDYKKSDLKNV